MDKVIASSRRKKRQLQINEVIMKTLKQLLVNSGMEKEAISFEIKEAIMQFELQEKINAPQTK